MGIGNNFDQFMHAIQSDTEQWSTINGLREGENFTLLIDTVRGEDMVLPPIETKTKQEPANTETKTAEVVGKTLKKTVSGADEVKLKWLSEKSVKTKQHVLGLASTVDKSNPVVLKRVLNTLGELKKELTATANNGYPHLKVTYAGQETTTGEPVADVLLKEQKKLCDDVIAQIDRVIDDFGTTLQAKKNAQLLEIQETAKRVQAHREKSIAAKAFDTLSRLMPKEKIPLGPIPIDVLIDTTFSKQWEEVMKSGKWKDFIDKKDEPNLRNPSIVPGQLLAKELKRQKEYGELGPKILLAESEGKEEEVKKLRQQQLQNQPLTIKDEKGQDVVVPYQFALDLHRLTGFIVNGETQYSTRRAFEYNTGKAYGNLCKAAQEKVGKEKSDLLANRIAAIINQGMFADLTGKVLVLNAPLFPSGSGQIWSVDIKDDKVIITSKISFALRETNPDAEDKYPGAVIVKREIVVPMESLLADGIETKTEPLPGVKVTDTFSKRLASPEYAEGRMADF